MHCRVVCGSKLISVPLVGVAALENVRGGMTLKVTDSSLLPARTTGDDGEAKPEGCTRGVNKRKRFARRC